MSEHANKVEQCIPETKRICECVDDLSKAQDRAVIRSFGLSPNDTDCSTSDSDSDSDLQDVHTELT